MCTRAKKKRRLPYITFEKETRNRRAFRAFACVFFLFSFFSLLAGSAAKQKQRTTYVHIFFYIMILMGLISPYVRCLFSLTLANMKFKFNAPCTHVCIRLLLPPFTHSSSTVSCWNTLGMQHIYPSIGEEERWKMQAERGRKGERGQKHVIFSISFTAGMCVSHKMNIILYINNRNKMHKCVPRRATTYYSDCSQL